MSAASLLMQTGIDYKHATVYLVGDVDDDMYDKLVKALALFRERDSIAVVLNTEGGDFYQALAMYDLLKTSGKNIRIYCSGPVMSAGVIILQAATERIAYKNSQILVHYGEEMNDSGTVAKHNQKMFKLMKNIIGDRVNVGRRTLSRWFNQETYLNAEDALSAGLIDSIVGRDNE
jgi:ATP-dependent protease ClpP protease subunit